MNVAEVKALEPAAEVYELPPTGRYVIVLTSATVGQNVVEALRAALVERGLENVIIIGGTDVRIFDLSQEQSHP
jgi:hypothetical protein